MKKISQFAWPTGDTSFHGKQISVHTRELAPATRSRSKAPSSAPTISSEKYVAVVVTFAPGFCSLISNWFDMGKQAPGENLLHESVSGASSLVCTGICLPWNDVSPVGQSNWLIFSTTTHCELTFKMAAEEVEEDSVQIIDNKKTKKLHGVSQIQD